YATVSWDTNDYDHNTYTDLYTGEFVSTDVDKGSGSIYSSGAIVKYDDYSHYWSENPYAFESGTISSYVNVPVIPNANKDPEHRTVYFNYYHTWNELVLQSVSFSSNGDVSLTFSSSQNQWIRNEALTEEQFNDGGYTDQP
ncbi:MAG: hypothetical protein SXQ77_08585, partial [Halobacteria archaeon]|nr:hypothetical protein [Halobacteria archaeon]